MDQAPFSQIRMASVFGIIGATAAAMYYILLDPLRASVSADWFTRDLELLAMYGGVGFVVGCIMGWAVGFLLSKLGRDE